MTIRAIGGLKNLQRAIRQGEVAVERDAEGSTGLAADAPSTSPVRGRGCAVFKVPGATSPIVCKNLVLFGRREKVLR